MWFEVEQADEPTLLKELCPTLHSVKDSSSVATDYILGKTTADKSAFLAMGYFCFLSTTNNSLDRL